jgi:hypothetical protein
LVYMGNELAIQQHLSGDDARIVLDREHYWPSGRSSCVETRL